MVFPTERKYHTEWRKFGLKSSVMLHLLSPIVPRHSKSHSQSQHTGTHCLYTQAHAFSHRAHSGICKRTNKHKDAYYLHKYILFLSIHTRIQGIVLSIGSYFMCVKAELLSLCVLCVCVCLSWIQPTPQPPLFVCLVCVVTSPICMLISTHYDL